jgi:carbamoyltransferase
MYCLGYSGYTRNSSLGIGVRSPFAKINMDFNNIFEFREGEVPFSMFPLGYFGHDASAALLLDGRVIACASEERFSRIKYSLNLAGNTLLPKNAIRFCLDKAGITINDVDVVAHYCNFNEELVNKRLDLLKPFISSREAIQVRESYLNIYKTMMSRSVLVGQFTKIMGTVPKEFIQVRHHEAHAASAFYPSGFEEALILTLDGTGEIESSMLAIGTNNSIKELSSVFIPNSLGALYLIISVFLGFKSLGDEYKVMGLASYGDPQYYRSVFNKVVLLSEKGNYFTSLISKPGFKDFLVENLGPARNPGSSIEKRHADIAASLQEVLNNTVLHTLNYYQSETKLSNLAMAGGVALNCTLNGVLARSGLFKNIFVQPAASDEGGSIGAALYSYFKTNQNTNHRLVWKDVYFGPEYSEEDILSALELFKDKIVWTKQENICRTVASHIAEGKVVGWFQGRMEFGPRALGNRSIIADPRDPHMKDKINEKVKRRESFRPFAPAVLEEDVKEYFDITGLKNSPFMLFTVPVKKEKHNLIPSVTHVDGTSRVQTVSSESNKLFWNLINEFKILTGLPVVLNTSFNVKNEPIVCSPKDALSCFLSTNIDCVAIGNYFALKRNGYE